MLEYLSSIAEASVYGVKYTHFYFSEDIPRIYAIGRAAGVPVEHFGGHPNAERNIFAFSRNDEPWPLACLKLRWQGDIGHRDILGAALALGIRREVLGDILVGEGEALLYCEQTIAGYLQNELRSVGRASVEVTFVPIEEKLTLQTGDFFEDRVVVASPRVDAILSACFSASRGEIAQWISKGYVFRNHELVRKPDAKLIPGDLLSVRGHGRIKLDNFTETKKGCLGIHIYRSR